MVFVSEEEEVRYYMDMKKKARLDAAARETRAERRGEARGEARGITKGETSTIRRTIIRAFQLGWDPAVIADITGASLEEIERIRKELA